MAQDDIQGQVVDAQGNPVDGAIVELTKSYQSSPTGQEAVQRTTTDSNGNYIFEGHPDGDGTTQEWHVSCYNHDGTAYVNSFNNPGVTADLPTAIPDSVVSLYEFEDNSDTNTAVDSVGDNDLDLASHGSYDNDAAVGNLALFGDGSSSNPVATSQNTIDLSAAGDSDGFGIPCWIKPSNDSGTEYVGGWAVDGDNFLHIRLSGTITAALEVGGSFELLDSGVSVNTAAYEHVYAEVTGSDLLIYVDGSEEASTSHGLDVTTMGSGNYYTHTNATNNNTSYKGLIDDLAPATDPLSDSELQTLIDRGN